MIKLQTGEKLFGDNDDRLAFQYSMINIWSQKTFMEDKFRDCEDSYNRQIEQPLLINL